MYRLSVLTLCLVSASVFAEIQILPPSITLTGKESSQRLIVQKKIGEVLGQQLADATYTSSNPKVAKILGDTVLPVSDGEAVITAKAGGTTSTAKVKVTGISQAHQWSFRNHVLAVISKVGCNSGACHGALAGKGGFKLSLRG